MAKRTVRPAPARPRAVPKQEPLIDLPPVPLRRGRARDVAADRLAQLGFAEHPFLLSAQPRYMFLSKQHRGVINRIQDVITDGEGLAVVEGPNGVGKTTIARHIYEQYREQQDIQPTEYRTRYIDTARYSTQLEALGDIAGNFGLKLRRSMADQRNDFRAFLMGAREADQDVVVILDDAQKISTDALEIFHDLFNFDYKRKLVQIILFAQSEIMEKFTGKDALRDRVAAWQKLSALSPQDAWSMIAFRCGVAGRDDPLLTDSAFERIYDSSNGVPRPIVSICNELVKVLIEQRRQQADVDQAEVAIQQYQQRFPDAGNPRR